MSRRYSAQIAPKVISNSQVYILLLGKHNHTTRRTSMTFSGNGQAPPEVQEADEESAVTIPLDGTQFQVRLHNKFVQNKKK